LHFRVTHSSYVEYSANDVLLRKMTWADLERLKSPPPPQELHIKKINVVAPKSLQDKSEPSVSQKNRDVDSVKTSGTPHAGNEHVAQDKAPLAPANKPLAAEETPNIPADSYNFDSSINLDSSMDEIIPETPEPPPEKRRKMVPKQIP